MRKISFILVITMLLTTIVACSSQNMPKERPEDFSFNIRWGHGLDYSYDSSTGQIKKVNIDGDYYGTLYLEDDILDTIYSEIESVNIYSYEDKYLDYSSIPPYQMELSVQIGETSKTVYYTDSDASWNFNHLIDLKKRRFMKVCWNIIDIITATYQWEEVPENGFMYE